MIIKKGSIRSTVKYLPTLKPGQMFKVGMQITEKEKSVLNNLGFPLKVENGFCLIPKPVGRATNFNANGKEIPRPELPKVSKSIMVYTSWNDWHSHSHSGIVNRTIKVNQIDLVLPPSEYLYIFLINGSTYLTSADLINAVSEENRNVHIINMFLEIFGSCMVLDQTNAPITAPKIVKLNWEVLPAGEYPWVKAKSHIEKITSTLRTEEKEVVEYRIQRISRFNPDFIAVGHGGFHGYFVLGFKRKNLYVLESVHLGNATYIFDKDWQSLSQLTKKEILDENLHHSRMIHNDKWAGSISYLLSK